jgi:Methyltransferase domain
MGRGQGAAGVWQRGPGALAGALFSRLADSNNPASLSARFRRARFARFVRLLALAPPDRILDVGGAPGTWIGSGYERQVTLVNLSFGERPPPFTYLVADARAMREIATGAFDVVHSNSLIEHVGGADDQQAAAREIARVGRRYWVQTPYRHFPLEAHFLFPFFQYLPPAVQKRVALAWPLSHYRRAAVAPDLILAELGRLRLLDRDDLRALFPQAEIFAETVAGLPKSLVAYRR